MAAKGVPKLVTEFGVPKVGTVKVKWLLVVGEQIPGITRASLNSSNVAARPTVQDSALAARPIYNRYHSPFQVL